MGLYPRRQWADSRDQRKELRVSVAQTSPSLNCFDALQMRRTSGDVAAPCAELCLVEEGVWVPGVLRPLLAGSQGPSWAPAVIREQVHHSQPPPVPAQPCPSSLRSRNSSVTERSGSPSSEQGCSTLCRCKDEAWHPLASPNLGLGRTHHWELHAAGHRQNPWKEQMTRELPLCGSRVLTRGHTPQISRSDEAPGASPPCLRLPSAVCVLAEHNEPLEQGLEGRERTLGAGRMLADGSHPGGQSPRAHSSLLSLPAMSPGLAEMGFMTPQVCPLLSPCAHPEGKGPGGAAPGLRWLQFAGSSAPSASTVISAAKLPAPGQNAAMLGEALYSQRQTTHICFLTVGIAPTGTERTGSLLSPSPCD